MGDERFENLVSGDPRGSPDPYPLIIIIGDRL